MALNVGDFTPFVILVSRNLFGWLENSLQDRQISAPDLVKLAETLARMAPVFILAFFGLNLDPTQAAALAVGGDVAVLKASKALERKK